MSLYVLNALFSFPVMFFFSCHVFPFRIRLCRPSGLVFFSPAMSFWSRVVMCFFLGSSPDPL